jgi:hypothetical protein
MSAVQESNETRTTTPATRVYTGECFCGAICVEARGEPEAMGYCHCESCRQWSASPVNAFTLWKPEHVSVIQGRQYLSHVRRSEKSDRQFCRQCGGHVMTWHPGFGLVDIFAAVVPGLEFKPAVHVNYAETVLRMKDGLPKLRDSPAELGGSGESMPE